MNIRKIGVILTSVTFLSHTLGVETNTRDGLYMGISLGNTYTSLKSDNKEFNKFEVKSLNGGLIVGYNHLIEETPIFIGVEGSAQSHGAKTVNYTFSGSIKGGIVIKDLMIYGKGGITLSKWKETIRADPGFGGGIDYNLNKNWAVGMEYWVMRNSPMKFMRAKETVRITPLVQTRSIRLIYKF